MARYVDLHVVPQVDNKESCGRLAELLTQVHYSSIGLTVPTGLLTDRVRSLQGIFEAHALETSLRIDLSPTSRDELLRALRRFRNQYDIVAVKCSSQRVSAVACRDRRVDIVFFNPANQSLRFTHTFARLLHGAIEFNLVSDLTEQPDMWPFLRIRKAMSIAQEHRVRVVLSSGARHHRMIRSPLQLMALASSLGLSREISTRGVTTEPSSILATNRAKRSPEFVEEGVKMIIPAEGNR